MGGGASTEVTLTLSTVSFLSRTLTRPPLIPPSLEDLSPMTSNIIKFKHPYKVLVLA
jgi:hypothetical protein